MDVKKEVSGLVLFGWNWVKYSGDFPQFKLMQEALYHLEELDISYSFVSNGEERGDIEEYRYDSERNNELSVPIPQIYCEFDDEETFKEMEKWNRKLENEMEEEM